MRCVCKGRNNKPHDMREVKDVVVSAEIFNPINNVSQPSARVSSLRPFAVHNGKSVRSAQGARNTARNMRWRSERAILLLFLTRIPQNNHVCLATTHQRESNQYHHCFIVHESQICGLLDGQKPFRWNPLTRSVPKVALSILITFEQLEFK